MLIPIGTDVRSRRVPVANYVLIALNVGVFFVTDLLGGERLKDAYTLDGARPLLYQYLTYQFLHGDIYHLAGNMLFLWIFGNAVCDRMGSACYAMFYLAGGVFAGIVFAYERDNPIIGASGAIAAVTTAFLVLFPRVHITMLFWLFIVFTFQLPAMFLIVFKIILWDNVLAPSLDPSVGRSNVAFSAHLGGYLFGFAVAMLLLAIRGLPRNQFDMLALWGRWRRRSGFAVASGTGRPRLARPILVEQVHSRPLEALVPTPIELLREQISQAMMAGDMDTAAARYVELMRLDPQQVLARSAQLETAKHLARLQRYAEAVHAFETFLAAYPGAPDVYQVRLLLGLIYRRHLREPDRAATQLRAALEGLSSHDQRALALEELHRAETQATD
jgi:membrane associated rhomboid family serine protease